MKRLPPQSCSPRNRQTKLQSPSASGGRGTAYFAYNSANLQTERLLANGVKLTATYDTAGRLATWRYTNASGGELAKWDYARDAKGLPRKIVREGNRAIYYDYDAADRLTAELWRDTSGNTELHSFRYAYDQAGNRLKTRRDGVDTYYQYDSGNRLTKRGSNATLSDDQVYYTYDDNGSLIKEFKVTAAETTYFNYNAAGLIAKITWPDTTQHTFYYDANLQRYAMDENGTRSYFLWDGLNVLQERDAAGAVKVENTNCNCAIPGIAQLVESYRPAEMDQKIYPVMDVRGSITKWVKADGTVAASREYDAFGVVLDSSGAWPSRFGYQGQAWMELPGTDEEMMLSPTRVYGARDGRFLANDPLSWYVLRISRRRHGSQPEPWPRRRQRNRGTWRSRMSLNLNLTQYSKQNPGAYVDAEGWADVDFNASLPTNADGAVNFNHNPGAPSTDSGWNLPPGALTGVGAALVASGQPWLAKPGGIGGGGATGPRTSLASKACRAALPAKMPIKLMGTRVLGGAVGRVVPYAGWALIASDVVYVANEIYAPALEQVDWDAWPYGWGSY